MKNTLIAKLKTYAATEIFEYSLLSTEFEMISEFYKDQKAERSEVPYINHIVEGLWVLDQIDASMAARRAYAIHPMLQGDEEIAEFDPIHANSVVLLNAVEYRNVANRYLSFHYGKETRKARLSPLKDVNDMLIADKVQNRKDFEKFHYGTHENSERLGLYFAEWLAALGVSEERYQEFATVLNSLDAE